MALGKVASWESNVYVAGVGVISSLLDGIYNLPTLNVSRSGTLSLSGIAFINFIGAVTAKIQSASLIANTPYTFVNTSGAGPVVISLDNGGTVGGSQNFSLASGQAVRFQFVGSNLQ